MGFALRRKDSAKSRAASSLPAALGVVNSPGRELDAATRAIMEPRFGHDFSRVRVHTGSEAAASARDLNATAYTVGQHVVFDQGEYRPGTQQGRKLLAHELTHTIQQNKANQASGPLILGAARDESESEAGRAASAVDDPTPVAVHSRRPVAVQRQVSPSAPPHVDLAESASPSMARAFGSVTIDGFETGKAIVSKSNQAELAITGTTILTLMKKYPGSTLRVIGHTDAVGKEMDNESLGQERADAVQAALVGLGIPAAAIQTESMGATKLLVQTKKAEPRNRRAEVKFEPKTREFAKFIPDTSLTPPTPPAGSGGFGFKPNLKLPPEFNVTPGPPFVPKDPPGSVPSRAFEPIPPLPPGKSKPVTNPIESFAESITSFLPKPVRGIAKDLVVGAIAKGVTTGLDAGLEKAGVDQKSREAIEKGVEATIKLPSGGKK